MVGSGTARKLVGDVEEAFGVLTGNMIGSPAEELVGPQLLSSWVSDGKRMEPQLGSWCPPPPIKKAISPWETDEVPDRKTGGKLVTSELVGSQPVADGPKPGANGTHQDGEDWDPTMNNAHLTDQATGLTVGEKISLSVNKLK